MSFKLELDPKPLWRTELGLTGDSVVVCDEGGCQIVPRKLGPRQETEEEQQERAKKLADIIANAVAEPVYPYVSEDHATKDRFVEDLKSKGHYTTKITDGWIPVADAALQEAGLKDGDAVDYFVSHGQVVIRKKGALQDAV